MIENWADIPRHPDFMISDQGRVKSKARTLVNCKGVRRHWAERILTSHPNDSGYWSIVLNRRGHFIQVLVAKAFVPNPENKPCVNHIDTDKSNNKSTNLEWVTYAENMEHAHDNGLCNAVVGSNHHLAKLREADIPIIRHLHTQGESIERIATHYGVSDWCVTNIIKGKSWKRA